MKAPEIQNRIRGAVYGAAIGDALGSAFEFISAREIHAAIGGTVVRDFMPALPGSLMHPRKPGIPTDDTAMALALAHALADGEPTPEHLAEQFRTLLARDGRFGDLFWNGGPGNACIAMLNELQAGSPPFKHISSHAGGNGGAMRAYPCGVFRDEETVVRISNMQSKLSHPHPTAVAAARAVALCVHRALHDGVLSEKLSPLVIDGTMRAAWDRAHFQLPARPHLPANLLDVKMSAWETAAAAHAIAKAFEDDPETAIGIAAASGNDTDTVATITGALVGARNGFDALPKRWVEGVAMRDDLEEAAQLLNRIAGA